jgi:hypothetical protein
MHANIHNYIQHSQERLEERQDFHQKNIREFEKYLNFDVDFTRRRDF